MSKIFTNKKYCGLIWHLLFAGSFISLSLFFLEFTEGVTWYLVSTALRITFGTAILIVSSRLFDRKVSEIMSFKNTKGALLAGIGFLIFFVYEFITVVSGAGEINGLTAAIFLANIILQQASTGFYEEINYRFLLLEGLRHTGNDVGMKILYVMVSSVLFGLLHCVEGWDTYTFLRTGAMGFAFAVIFVRSGNIVVPMILHFLFDVIANMTEFIKWDHNAFFDNMSSVFEIMLVIMVVISFVILVMPQKQRQTEKEKSTI